MYIIMARRPRNRGSIVVRGRKSLLESVHNRYEVHSVSVQRARNPHCLAVKRTERETDYSPLLLPMLRMSAAMTPHPLHPYGVHRDNFIFSCILILYQLFSRPRSTRPAVGFYQWAASHLLRFCGNCFRNSRSRVSLASLKLRLPLRAFRR